MCAMTWPLGGWVCSLFSYLAPHGGTHLTVRDVHGLCCFFCAVCVGYVGVVRV